MSETIALASKRTNEEEINCLRDHFKENIRVLENIGQLSYIIKICLDEYDASLTFQLDSSYPIKPPEIILTAPRLTPEQILSASKYLQSYSQTLIGQVMVLNIYKQLLKWFAENNIQMVRISGEKSPQILSSVTTNGTSYFSKKSNINGRRNSISEENKEKTSSMKIVDDIISRIQLDTRLKKEHFSIGYIDQFLGVQEKLFTDFNFEIDLKCLDNRCSTKLCIPKHRIQYFKYHNEIIWDKCTRTDNISDSTCGQLTLYDIIQRLPPIIKDNNSKTNDDNERSVKSL
ncbi:unnamed protein product [Didymodactylos carnosus]|uniref:RWD domain-containing protein n=1 Tax=Didymodactylos carnosus TaxID=1234261 RepID=A0A814N0L3_9BILA|nr:unnamed protein product [Didymodactylos carnosus]CAF1322942.1 unnamed protein product [Didymodactylos carnosus]CAF3852431.1 unnamed protein product [Didymodactylos carnosus]CAF4133408.1 unnamed protein product [Didymodactylos carnosus]